MKSKILLLVRRKQTFAFEFRKRRWGCEVAGIGEILRVSDTEKRMFSSLSQSWKENVHVRSSDVTLNRVMVS